MDVTGQQREQVLSDQVEAGAQTKVITLGDECLHPLRHSTSA